MAAAASASDKQQQQKRRDVADDDPGVRIVARLSALGGAIKVDEEPVPRVVPPGAVVVDILFTSVSSAARQVFGGSGHFKPPAPYIPGPSCVGTVVRTAEDVYGFCAGDVVVLDPLVRVTPNNASLPPSLLLIGWFPLSGHDETAKIVRRWKDGCWTTTAILPASNLHVVDNELCEALTPQPQEKRNMSWIQRIGGDGGSDHVWENRALHTQLWKLLTLNNFCVAHGALQRGGFKGGQDVLGLGSTGPLGTCCVQLALALGCGRVFVVGRNVDVIEQLAELDARVVPVIIDGAEATAAAKDRRQRRRAKKLRQKKRRQKRKDKLAKKKVMQAQQQQQGRGNQRADALESKLNAEEDGKSTDGKSATGEDDDDDDNDNDEIDDDDEEEDDDDEDDDDSDASDSGIPVAEGSQRPRSVRRQVLRQVGESGVDLLIDFLGYSDSSEYTLACMGTLRQQGCAVFAGGVRARVGLDYADMLVKELTVVGSFMYSGSSPQEVMRLMHGGSLALDLYSAQHFSGLDHVEEAMAEASKKAGGPFNLCVMTP